MVDRVRGGIGDRSLFLAPRYFEWVAGDTVRNRVALAKAQSREGKAGYRKEKQEQQGMLEGRSWRSMHLSEREDLALSTPQTYLPAACPSNADGHGQGRQEISEKKRHRASRETLISYP